ncbi:MAG: hypothetical protein JST16_13220 [Bdellovibrionales bacterium]|nr:hypothetical protein [Bdellovibrionales bacterium]
MRDGLYLLLLLSFGGNAWACDSQQWLLRGPTGMELTILQAEIIRSTGLIVSRTEEIRHSPARMESWVLMMPPEATSPSAAQSREILKWQNEVLRNFPDNDFYCSPIHYPPGAVTGNN